MAINSDTHNVVSKIFKEAEKQIDDFHFHVILPNASQCHKERNQLIAENNGLKEIYKSILSKISKHYQALLDQSVKKEVLSGACDFTEKEIQLFNMASHDYLHQMRINHEKLKVFNADQQIVESHLKKIEIVQKEIIHVEFLF